VTLKIGVMMLKIQLSHHMNKLYLKLLQYVIDILICHNIAVFTVFD